MKYLILFFLFPFVYLNAQSKVADKTDVIFDKLILFEDYISEGAAIGDMDNDGHPDIIAGSLWWQGPDFKNSYSFAPVKSFPQQKDTLQISFPFPAILTMTNG